MSNVVKKGAGRAAHAERTNRHAQRTVLPQKRREPAVVEQEARETAEAVRGTAADGPRSAAKGKAFADSIRALGWEIEPSWGGGEDHVVVTATRGAEVIFIEWLGGVFQPTATYAQGDRVVRVRNASAAKQYASRTPEQAAEETAKVSANRFFRKREAPAEDVDAKRQPLPFDPALALDEEVFANLAGKRITWYNRVAQTPDSAVFPIEYRKEFTHITEFQGERIVNFVDHGGTGFRSFRLSGLLSVSRGKSVTVKRTEQLARRAAAGAR
jgi:type II secretory pathway component PulM